jgi:hypothetical protein
MRTFLRGKVRVSPALMVSVAALVVALGGVAYAAIPDSSGVIHGCYLNKIGVLRVIDSEAGQKCSSFETPLNWNQTGPPGPAGANGATNVVVRASVPITLSANTASDVTANCNPGEIAVGGGGHSLGPGIPRDVAIYGTQPTLNGAPDLTGGETANGWRVDAQNNAGFDTELQAYVMCASP